MRRLAIILLVLSGLSSASQKPFWKFLSLATWSGKDDIEIVSVNAGEYFILTHISVQGAYDYTSFWVDNTQAFFGMSAYDLIYGSYVIEGPKIFHAKISSNGSSITKSQITVSGYISNGCPVSDLNGDCRVDLNDLVIFASEWLL